MEQNSTAVRCLIIGNHPTLHWLDEARSKPGSPWAVCSWFADGDHKVVPLARARERYPHHVPCDACFPGRVLPTVAQSAIEGDAR